MGDSIDYVALCDSLQKELEQARLEILRLRYSRAFRFDMRAASQFMAKHAFTIASFVLVVAALLSFFDTVRSFRRNYER